MYLYAYDFYVHGDASRITIISDCKSRIIHIQSVRVLTIMYANLAVHQIKQKKNTDYKEATQTWVMTMS